MHQTNRRAFLVGSAALTVAAASSAGAVPSAIQAGATNPDAALLQAWAEHLEARRVIAAIPAGLSDEEYNEAFGIAWVPADAASSIMADLPAHTPAGVVAKLKLLLMNREIRVYHDAILSGDRAVEDDGEEIHDRMLWSLIQDVERMASV